MEMDELSKRILAGLDREERAARVAAEEWGSDDAAWSAWDAWSLSAKLEDSGWFPPPVGFDAWWQQMNPGKALDFIAAMREIVELEAEGDGGYPDGFADAKVAVLRLLARRYG